MNTPMPPPRSLVCTHCRGTLFVREMDDTFTCLMCGRAARTAMIAVRTDERAVATPR